MEPLGQGGMGEVFLAEDPRLGRRVAVKVLPPHLAQDPGRLALFDREARAAAALNHPHIAAVFDVGAEHIGSVPPVHYIVQELLEGQTLRAYAHTALTLRRALDLAIELSEALAAAHHAGILHRDIKPENLFVTRDGHLKVLDFGLATLNAPDLEMSQASNVQTATLPGRLLGTPGYLAPEQIENRPADRRSDIFSAGCVLHEMATGHRAFSGRTTVETLNKIVHEEPPPLAAALPFELQRIVRKCLAKDPQERYQTAADLAVDLRALRSQVAAGTAVSAAALRPPNPMRRPSRVWIAAIALILLAAASLVAVWLRTGARAASSVPTARLSVTLPPGVRIGDSWTAPFALSPSGSELVFVGDAGGTTRLYRRSLNSFDAVPIAGTENGNSPFFSPDGGRIGFVTLDGTLKQVALSGTSPQTLAHVPGTLTGASWGRDDVIVFAGSGSEGLQAVPAAGGAPVVLTKPDSADTLYRWPHHLPDGRTILFSKVPVGQKGETEIFAWSADMGAPKSLNLRGVDPHFVPSGAMRGYVLAVQPTGLVAMPLALDRLEPLGGPILILEGLQTSPINGGAAFATAGDTLVFAPQTSARGGSLVFVGQNGFASPATAEIPRVYHIPRLSPDGRRIAVGILDVATKTTDIWIYDFSQSRLNRLTFGGQNLFPVWSPDGRRVAFSSSRAGSFGIFTQPWDGSEEAVSVIKDGATNVPVSWGSGGLFFTTDASGGQRDIRVTSAAGVDSETKSILQSQADERAPVVSPDGRWLAYLSDETGRYELWVVGLPSAGPPRQLSSGGATEPAWSKDGSKLYYRTGRSVMQVVFRAGSAVGASERVFEGPFDPDPFFNANYDLAPDGRWLMVQSPRLPEAEVRFVFGFSQEVADKFEAAR